MSKKNINISSLYIPNEDQNVWSESEILAKALGLSRSQLVVEVLKKVINDPKAKILIANQSQPFLEGARSILHDILDAKQTSKRASNAANECGIGI